jgi:hypothetical protein
MARGRPWRLRIGITASTPESREGKATPSVREIASSAQDDMREPE